MPGMKSLEKNLREHGVNVRLAILPGLEQVKTLSEKYNAHLNFIVEFMMPYITKVFGTFSFDEIKEKLGKPVIDYENGRVNYFEQSFDDTHIFTFEFSDDEFEDLQYFSIDG